MILTKYALAIHRKIAGVHKVKDKKTGGWFMAQEFVFLILVTDRLMMTIWYLDAHFFELCKLSMIVST